MRNLYIILLISILYSCGYEPIYSSKNFLFRIDKIYFEENKINNQIARSLKSISNQNAEKNLSINFSANKEKNNLKNKNW